MIIRQTNRGGFQVVPENYTLAELSRAPAFSTHAEAEAWIVRPTPQWVAEENEKQLQRSPYLLGYAAILGSPVMRERRQRIQELYAQAMWEAKLAHNAQRAAVLGSGETSCLGRDIGAVRQVEADRQGGEADSTWRQYEEAVKHYEQEVQNLMREAGIPIVLFRSPVLSDGNG